MSTAEESLDYGESGFDVTDEVEVGDLSSQTGGDAIEPARKVRFEIRKATIRPYVPKDSDEWLAKYLSLDLVVGPEGIGEDGKYKGKHFFQDLLLKKNVDAYPAENTEKYKSSGRFDLKVFLKAMGYDPAKPPKFNDDLLIELTGKEVYGDITRKAKRAATGETDANGRAVWAPTGEFSNEVKNFRAVEA
jgi:hypothetical protein